MPGPTLVLFITGFPLVRHRGFEHPLAHRWLLAIAAAAGLVSWLAANWLIERWAAIAADAGE